MNEIRLQLALAKAGLASRRHAEELIVAGRVAVNGRVVTELGSKVDPVSDRVTVDGNPVLREAPAYYLMNKPKGYVTTAEDPEGRLTVFSLMKNSSVRLFSVGRLDYNTEGALLLTNDGELAHALMHPSRGVAKVYHAKFRGLVEKEQVAMLRRGVDLPPARPLDKDGKPLPTMKGSDKPERSAPAEVTVINSTGRHSWLQFILHEGKNRQIHRMAEAVGSSLLKLLRVEYAGLSLNDLPAGEYRPLQTREVLELRQSVGLRPFAAQDGPVKPRVRVEEEEAEAAPEPRAGGKRREEPGPRAARPWQPAPSRSSSARAVGSVSAAPGSARRTEWGQDRPSGRDGGERDRPAYEQRDRPSYGAGAGGRDGAPTRPRPAAWSQDRPGGREGGETRERTSYGASKRGSAPRSPRPAWNQDRPSGRDGGEPRDRPPYGAGAGGRGGAPIRPRPAAWSQDRPSPSEGGETRERPAFAGSDRSPARSPRPAWGQDRPSSRDGGDQRPRPAFGAPGRDAAPGRPRPAAGSQDRPSPREGGESRDRGAADRGAAPRAPRPAWSADRPPRRDGGDRPRTATSPGGRSDFPPRPRRPEGSPDRPATREGRDRDRSGPPARPHRAPPARRPDARNELPHDWPPR